MSRALYYGSAAAAALLAFWLLSSAPSSPGPVAPAPCPGPGPNPRPDPTPRPRWVTRTPAVAGPFGNPEPMVDLLAMPGTLRKANITSRGLGCCTFRSGEYSAHWQQVPALYGWPEWLREQGIAGGGTPSKQAALVERIAKARGLPTPPFAQYTGSDSLPFIELCLKTGRPVGVTWGGNHMLTCVHLDAERAAIVDNNAPDRVQWFSRSEFARRHMMGGGGWCFVLLAPPPPAPPRNLNPPPQPLPRTAAKDCPCSPACTCGCNQGGACLCRRGAEEGGGGVEWTYSEEDGERITIGSQLVSWDQVEAALTDDSAKHHLTVIAATPELRSQALAACGDVSRYRVQSYSPDHWALGCGFTPPAPGQASVVLQRPDGAVLLRTSEITPALAGKLRRADPTYQPSSDPTGGIALPDLSGLKGYAPWLAAAGVGAAVWLVMRSKGGTAEASAPAQPRPAPASDQVALELGRRLLIDRAVAQHLTERDQTTTPR